MASSSRCELRNIPDDKGFCVPNTAASTFELQDSDVVCCSAAADADGYHSLIQTTRAWRMPPLATVTLEKQQPGEWEVLGHKVQRRLFTVSVSYR